MTNLAGKLHDYLESQGIKVVGVSQQQDGTFRVTTVDPSQQSAADAIASNFVPAPPTEGDLLDGLPLSTRAMAALLIRTSTQWAGLSAARKSRVQAILDNAATAAINILS